MYGIRTYASEPTAFQTVFGPALRSLCEVDPVSSGIFAGTRHVSGGGAQLDPRRITGHLYLSQAKCHSSLFNLGLVEDVSILTRVRGLRGI